MKNTTLALLVLGSSSASAAWDSQLAFALRDKAVEDLVVEQSKENRKLLSAKDLLVETLYQTGFGDTRHQVIELTFISHPRPGGTPAPVICQVRYPLNSSSLPTGTPTLSCK